MSAIGAFTFVLHSHLPYARLAGRWPHGEEWIHEAASETYVPLLEMLYQLKSEGVRFRLTIGITPVLAEQLADPLVLQHFDQFLDDKIAAARRDMQYFASITPDTAPSPQPVKIPDERKTATDTRIVTDALMVAAPDLDVQEVGATQYESTVMSDPHLYYLAEWYLNYYLNVKQVFNQRFNRDIIGALRTLQNEGYIEITTSAATHAYL
ncbi:MAG TPA: hypothetical protein VHL11_21810, partial [Phototrophicaceae bacterium]|nr:hypothetical protein [Phototrophicaceae bacterium]